jgi:hypothetical protein
MELGTAAAFVIVFDFEIEWGYRILLVYILPPSRMARRREGLHRL